MISHGDYDKLTDLIYTIGFNLILQLNVVLNKKSKDGKKISYHREYKYNTSKYIDTRDVITLKRTFDYYLTIEGGTSQVNNMREQVMLRQQDMKYIIRNLNNFIDHIDDSNLFIYKDKKLFITDYEYKVIMTGFSFNKYIKLQPVVYKYDEGSGDIEGARIYLNSDIEFADVPLAKIRGLVYSLETLDMFNIAQTLVNYLGRPEYGENLTAFSGENEIEGFVDMPERKAPTNKKNKNFFEKIDDLLE